MTFGKAREAINKKASKVTATRNTVWEGSVYEAKDLEEMLLFNLDLNLHNMGFESASTVELVGFAKETNFLDGSERVAEPIKLSKL